MIEARVNLRKKDELLSKFLDPPAVRSYGCSSVFRDIVVIRERENLDMELISNLQGTTRILLATCWNRSKVEEGWSNI